MTRNYTLNEQMAALLRYCAYRERNTAEVTRKMRSIGVLKKDENKLMDWLRDTKALNEARYAESFVNGKFHLKKWGKKKIEQHLKQNGTSSVIIETTLKHILPKEYEQTIRQLIEKKERTLKDTDPYIRKNKVARYLAGKGYEADIIWKILGEG